MSSWPIFYWNWAVLERLFPTTCSRSGLMAKHTCASLRTATLGGGLGIRFTGELRSRDVVVVVQRRI
jgi:hypothetical protein